MLDEEKDKLDREVNDIANWLAESVQESFTEGQLEQLKSRFEYAIYAGLQLVETKKPQTINSLVLEAQSRIWTVFESCIDDFRRNHQDDEDRDLSKEIEHLFSDSWREVSEFAQEIYALPRPPESKPTTWDRIKKLLGR